jgi:hypothetical protein
VRLVRIESVVDGMELARDIPSGTLGSAPLLRRGVHLTMSMAGRLAPRGVRAVWIEDDMGEGIVPVAPLSDDVRRSTESAVGSCLAAVKASGGVNGGTLGAEAIGQLENAAFAMLHALEDCPEAALALDDLANADSYTFTHSIRVATLGLVLASPAWTGGWTGRATVATTRRSPAWPRWRWACSSTTSARSRSRRRCSTSPTR